MSEKLQTNYVINIDGQLGNLNKTVDEAKKLLDGLMQTGTVPQISKVFDKIDNQIDKLRDKVSTPIKTEGAFDSMKQGAATIENSLQSLIARFQDLQEASQSKQITLLPQSEQKRLADFIKATNEFTEAITKAHTKTKDLAQAQKDLDAAEKVVAKRETELANAQDLAKQAALEKTAAKARLDALDNQKRKAKETAEIVAKLNAYFADQEAAGNKADRRSRVTVDGYSGTFNRARKNADAAAVAVPTEEDYKIAVDAYKQATQSANSFNTSVVTAQNNLVRATKTAETAKIAFSNLNAQWKKDSAEQQTAAIQGLSKAAKVAGADISSITTANTTENFDNLTTTTQNLVNAALAPLQDTLKEAIDRLEDINTAAQATSSALDTSKESFQEFDAKTKDVSSVITRTKAFIGLQGAANVARAAIRSAFETIKELDAQMTEMAVVTDENIGGYWDQLPEYTARANDLGVSIKAAYEAATLYYQQGLKTNDVIGVSNETLKMARISGLSAAEATDRMTAALRGFNMEVNETNAQRVSDVYSELAAITASDVDEISSAMTKTASIASSAGMEFETTAAFLSQIIETTRESAETAGTALKTVIARFQELKKDPSEIGEVDGEVVDANQIETALKSVGVALRDEVTGEFRQLDQVFLELSSKWNTLDTNTQRYIATIAAGSRQQSRFIAMMQDYSRTQQLVSAANSSAGVSQQQYNKTLESLETKLTKLKNSWDTFTMGLANNEFIKVGVDILNALITGINKVTQGFGTWSGSAIKIGLVTAALIAGDRALTIFKKSWSETGSILKSVGNVAKSAGQWVKNLTASIVGLFTKTNSKKYATALTETLDKLSKQFKQTQAGVETVAEAIGKTTKSTEGYKDMAAALATELQFSEIQTQALNAAMEQGATLESAAILAKSGLSAATITQLGALAAENAQIDLNTIAQNLNNATGLKAIIMKAQLTAGTWLYTVAQKAEKAGHEKNIIVKLASFAATQLLTKGLLGLITVIGIFLVIIAAVVATIVGIVALVKWLIANSPEGKLKALNEEAERAAETANDAKDAYQSLLDTIDSYDEAQNALEELTFGTQEWKDALLEANDVVLELLNQYPELAQYIERGAGGQLTIAQEGLNLIKEQSQQTVSDTQAAAALANINVGYAERDVLKNQAQWSRLEAQIPARAASLVSLSPFVLRANAITGVIDYATTGSNYEDMAASFKEATMGLAEGTDTYNEAVKAVQQQYGLTSAEMKALIPNFQSYNDLLDQQTTTLKSSANAALTAGASSDLLGYEYADSIINSFAEALAGEHTQKVLDQYLEDFDPAGSTDYKNQASFQRIAKENGVSLSRFNGNDSHDARVLYAAMTGKTEAEVKEADLSDEEMLRAIASMDYTKQSQKNMNDFKSRMEKMDSNSQRKVAGLLSDAGSLMTVNQIQNYNGQNLVQVMADTAQKLGYESIVDWAEGMNMTIDELTDMITENIDAAGIALDKAKQNLTTVGLGDLSVGTGKIGTKATQLLADKLVQMATNAGTEATRQFNDQLNNIINLVGPDDAEKVANMLSALDWKDADALDGIADKLTDLGVSIPTSQVDDFVESLKNTAHAISQIDLDELNEKLETSAKVVSDIFKGEQDRVFDAETAEALIAAMPELADQFATDLDGNSVYLGESMNELRLALVENTKAQEQKGVRQKADIIGAGEILTSMGLDDTVDSLGSDTTTWNSNYQRSLISTFLQNAKANGIDVDSLGIANLSNATDVDTLMKSGYGSTVLADLIKVMNARQTNIEEYKTSGRDSLLKIALADNIGNNVAGAAAARQRLARGGMSETNTLIAQTELDTYTAAIRMQANDAGIAQTEIAEYVRLLEEAKDATGSDLTTINQKLQKFEDRIASTTAMKKSREALEENMTAVSDLADEYDKLVNKADKMAAVADMVSKFGLVVTESNYAEYAKLAMAFSAGDFESYMKLVEESAIAAGVIADKTDTIPNNYDAMTGSTKEWADAMLAAGLAWTKTVDGVTTFGLYSQEVLAQMADIAGTTWENTYDWLYNLNEQLDGLLRKQERLNNLISRSDLKTIADAWSSGGSGVLQELTLTYDAIAATYRNQSIGQLNKLSQLLTENEQYKDYYSYDVANGIIQVDWEKISQEQKGSGWQDNFESFIDELGSNRDDIQDTLDQLYSAAEDIQETISSSRDSYVSLINSARDALVQDRQDQINALSSINDAITDTTSAITDKLQEQIDDQRTARDLEQSRLDLSDKQAKLLQLQASGASQLEILKLQKEISDDTQSYEDSLIDNALNEIQTANEKAAEQRQEQITLAQLQLENYRDGAQSLIDAEELYRKAMEAVADGTAFEQTPLYQLLTKQDKIIGQAEYEQLSADLLQQFKDSSIYASKETLESLTNTANNYVTAGTALETALKDLGILTGAGFTSSDGASTATTGIAAYTEQLKVATQTLSELVKELTKYNSNEDTNMEGGTNATGGSGAETGSGADGNYTVEATNRLSAIQTTNTVEEGKVLRVDPSDIKTTTTGQQYVLIPGTTDEAIAIEDLDEFMGPFKDGKAVFQVKRSNTPIWKLITATGGGRHTSIGGSRVNSRENLVYKTGGLADYTGPAWLDGTPTKPELVLNSTDTANFIQLKDILSEILRGGVSSLSRTAQFAGDNHFNIDINVEEIASDYDVDQMADHIKDIITNDALYRNVNAINHSH